MSTIIPSSDKVLIEVIKPEEKTKSGIIVPEIILARDTKSKSAPAPKGKIIAVGPGRYGNNGSFIPTQAEIGQVVVYSKARAINVETDGTTEQVLINEADILYIVQD